MNIVLTTRSDILAFLSSHPDPDETIVWLCPECRSRNYGIYFSHATKCSCGKGSFPQRALPFVGIQKYINKKLKDIEEEMKEVKYNIRKREEEIEEYEEWLVELEKEKVGIEGLMVGE